MRTEFKTRIQFLVFSYQHFIADTFSGAVCPAVGMAVQTHGACGQNLLFYFITPRRIFHYSDRIPLGTTYTRNHSFAAG